MTNRRTRRKKYRSVKRFRGGKVLGQGVNAKFIYPAVPCKDGRDMTKYGSRIPNIPERVMRKELLEKLKRIDPNQKYFIYPEYCEPGDLLPENIEDGVKELKTNEIQTRATETLHAYRKHNKLTDNQIQHLKAAINKLHQNKIVHADLHDYNILMYENSPRIGDFGNSTIVNATKQEIDLEKEYVKEFFPKFREYRSDGPTKLEKMKIELKALRNK
jgi:serine/threonine protein kinase